MHTLSCMTVGSVSSPAAAALHLPLAMIHVSRQPVKRLVNTLAVYKNTSLQYAEHSGSFAGLAAAYAGCMPSHPSAAACPLQAAGAPETRHARKLSFSSCRSRLRPMKTRRLTRFSPGALQQRRWQALSCQTGVCPPLRTSPTRVSTALPCPTKCSPGAACTLRRGGEVKQHVHALEHMPAAAGAQEGVAGRNTFQRHSCAGQLASPGCCL
jgi:hypothetical protein